MFDLWWNLWIKQKAKLLFGPTTTYSCCSLPILLMWPLRGSIEIIISALEKVHYFSHIYTQLAFDLHQRHNLTSCNGCFNVNSLRLKHICAASFDICQVPSHWQNSFSHSSLLMQKTALCRPCPAAVKMEQWKKRVWPHVTTAGAGLHVENNGGGHFDVHRTAPLCFGL